MNINLDNSLGFILNRTNTKMKNSLLHSFKEYGVTPEQWAVLNRLWVQEGLSPKVLAQLTSKDQPTTVRMLSKLEKKGYIWRQVNPKDNRSFLIYLTSEGKQLKNKLYPLAFEALDKAISGISEKEIELVKTVLNKIYRNLDS
ncbi:MarR family transcriptional regulator [Peptococcaceae bacterium 1198_IL3148]